MLVKRNTVFSIVIASALVLIAARFVAPFEVGKDQSSQLEAAQNLVQGRGLTTTNDVPPASFDITVDPQPRYLTWWPPGFSIILAAFLELGLSLLLSLKLIYAATTLLGWIGWGIILSQFVKEPLSIGGRQFPTHVVIAALAPIFFTLGWDGTDIFLWAGIPFVFLALVKQSERQASYLTAAVAGLLFGALYAVRYSSLFLGLAGLLILVQVRFPDYKDSLKRFAIFLASSLTLILPTYLYSKFYAVGTGGIADRATLSRFTSSLSVVIRNMSQKLYISANMIFGIPLPDQIIFKLNSTVLFYVSGIICAGILLIVPLLLIRNRQRDGQPFQSDRAFSLWLLPISLLGFLIGINLAVRLGLLGIKRYYEPLALAGFLVFYQLATIRKINPVTTSVARAVVVAFVLYVCAYMPVQAFLPERNGFLVETVLGYVPSKNVRYRGTSYKLSYPSFMMFSSKESSKRKLKELAVADPKALFFVEEYAFFTYDRFQQGGPVLGKTMRIFPTTDYWKQAHTSTPVRVYWVLNEQTDLNFVQPANQKLVYIDPVEQTKILVSEFPASYRFGDESKGQFVAGLHD